MRVTRRALAAVAAATLLAGACGRGPDVQADPEAALRSALDATGTWDGATVTLRLDVAEDDLPLLADVMEDEDAAHYLPATTITLSSFAGEDLADTSDDVMTMAVVVDGIDAFDVRAIRGELYVRSDVRALLTEFAPEVDVDAEVAELAVRAEAFGVDFLEEAVDGAWLHLTGAQQVASMLQGMGAVPMPQQLEPTELASEFAAASQRLVDQLTVTYVGSDDAGEHVQATTTGAALFDTFAPLVEASFGQMWEQFGAGAGVLDDLRSDPGFQGFSSTTIPLEAWIADGQLTQVGFDLVQLVRLNPRLVENEEDAAMAQELDRLLFAAALAPFGGEVETPADAIEVDLFELAGRAMGAFGGMGAGFGGGPTDA
ncbi:MAG: hypothetical protein KY461_07190 [Actinobacteria bacterium]|nr:hypothetical protein [Actinomycetota bacterium]